MRMKVSLKDNTNQKNNLRYILLLASVSFQHSIVFEVCFLYCYMLFQIRYLNKELSNFCRQKFSVCYKSVSFISLSSSLSQSNVFTEYYFNEKKIVGTSHHEATNVKLYFRLVHKQKINTCITISWQEEMICLNVHFDILGLKLLL